jgi:hypothetical protein
VVKLELGLNHAKPGPGDAGQNCGNLMESLPGRLLDGGGSGMAAGVSAAVEAPGLDI